MKTKIELACVLCHNGRNRDKCRHCLGLGYIINPKLIPTIANVRNIGAFFKPRNFVYIGRATGDWEESKWANPFRMKSNTMKERRRVLKEHRIWLADQAGLLTAIPELVGKKLGCWCAPKPCHGQHLQLLVIHHLSCIADGQDYYTT